ncbi:MAG TPA: hypothetical protein VHQ47_21185 [Phycisphaerae bacterium]|nr:hypothetical protein [Phycisphaerae bacterium]
MPVSFRRTPPAMTVQTSPETPPPSAPPPTPALAAHPRPKSSPPEWPAERLVKFIGRFTGALGKSLDYLATFPILKPILNTLNSIWVGISILILLALYIALGSGFANLRARMEMTDLQFFDWYPMRILVTWLALTLTVVTLRRIPLTLFKLGSWTVHVGILTLIGGSVFYFSHKTEGSMRLYPYQPRDSYFDATERALYTYPILANGQPDEAHATMTPLPNLPIYYEHLLQTGNAMNRPVPDSAIAPLGRQFKDVHATITGYYAAAILEPQWKVDRHADATQPAGPGVEEPSPAIRLSLTLTGVDSGQWLIANSPAGRVLDQPQDGNSAPFGIEYLYHPTPEQLADITTPLDGPLGITVRIPSKKFTKTFTVQQGQKIPLEGTPYSLEIGEQQVFPMLSKGYENAISNSLQVIITRKNPDGTTTTMDRRVLFRYPERSPDFITGPDGKPKRVQDRLDNDIQITFQDAQRDQFWIVDQPPPSTATAAAGKLELIERAAGGKVLRKPLPLGEEGAVQVNVGAPLAAAGQSPPAAAGVPMTLAVLDRTGHLVQVQEPSIIPMNQRKSGVTAMDAMQFSAVELQVTHGDFKDQRIFVPFVQFAQVGAKDPGREPTVVDVPGVGKLGFLLSTTRRPLPAEITLTYFHAVRYPGATHSYANYISNLRFTDKKTGATADKVAQLNEPAADRGLYYFQAGWAGPDVPANEMFSILGVGNRPGIWTMIVGAALMLTGIGYAFYVKPILLKYKKAQLAAWAAANRKPA